MLTEPPTAVRHRLEQSIRPVGIFARMAFGVGSFRTSPVAVVASASVGIAAGIAAVAGLAAAGTGGFAAVDS